MDLINKMQLNQFSDKMEELAEEVGIHIGDGSMNFYLNKGKMKGLYQLRGHIKDDSEYFMNHIKNLYFKIFGLKVSIREMKNDGVLGFQVWNNELVNFKKSLGLPLGKKGNISIPSIFLRNNKLKLAVIRGLFDTDGCIYLEKRKGKIYPRVEIRTTSSPLAYQVIKILRGVHIRATLYIIKRKNKKWKDIYCISIRGLNESIKFFKLIKPKNSKHLSKFKKLFQSSSGEADNREVEGSNPSRPIKGPVA